MPNPLRKLPTKPGRTAPSSRVKKKPKPGQRGVAGPRKFEDELSEDNTARYKDEVLRDVKQETGEEPPFNKPTKKGINRQVSHLRFINDEVPIKHNVGVFREKGTRKRRRGRFAGGVNEEPFVDPTEGLQSERLRKLLLLLEEKLNADRFPDDSYYSGSGESMNDSSYERYLNRG